MRLDLALAILSQTFEPAEARRVAPFGGSRRQLALQKRHIQDLWLSSNTHVHQDDDGTRHFTRSEQDASIQEQVYSKIQGHEEGRGSLKNTHSTDSSLHEEATAAECKPDIGVLSCGVGYYCMESTESSMGGYCAQEQYPTAESRQRRHLLNTNNGFCTPDEDGDGPSCDCSTVIDDTGTVEGCGSDEYYCVYLNEMSGFGSIGCYRVTYDVTYTADIGLQESKACYDGVAPNADPAYSLYACYTYTYNADGDYLTCSFSFDGVTCNSCEVITCDYGDIKFKYNCTNTRLGSTGDTCGGEAAPFGNAILASIAEAPNYAWPPEMTTPPSNVTQPPTTPPETTMPPSNVTQPPTTSPETTTPPSNVTQPPTTPPETTMPCYRPVLWY